jgi:hypothetical protein
MIGVDVSRTNPESLLKPHVQSGCVRESAFAVGKRPHRLGALIEVRYNNHPCERLTVLISRNQACAHVV